MSTGLALFVTVISLFTIFGCAFLLWWCWTDKMGVEEGKEMGHEFDGIVELNNQLPKWWAYMFVVFIIYGLGYLVLYPGLGNYEGLFKWKSAHKNVQSLEQLAAMREAETGIVEYDRDLARGDKIAAAVFAKFRDRPVTEIAYDDEAVQIGRRLFLQNCAQCHGSTARGGTGFPNLTDSDWLHGGSPEAIKETILHGRNNLMPPQVDFLGEQGLKEMTAYVLSLSGRKVNATDAAAGQAKFAVCAACHGAEGKGSLLSFEGNPEMQKIAAPNLTDQVWLYGGSRRAVEDTLRFGRNGVMPAFKEILGEDKIHLLTAYVYQLSHPAKAD